MAEEKKSNEIKQRVSGYKEIVETMQKNAALEEAKRCLQCPEPKCVMGCPAGVNCKEFIRQLRDNNATEAVNEILLHNPVPCVTGRVCQAFKQCEASCILAKTGNPIKISQLERFVADNSDYSFSNPKQANGKKIAIIGSGPAGLAAAIELRKKAYSVKLFEAGKKLGGLLTNAIPKYRLPESIAKRFIEQAIASGIEIETEKRLGKDIILEKLLEEFDAVLIASGEEQPKRLQINGNELNGVWYWKEFLETFNGKTGKLKGKKAIVIGGGDTAIDCSRVAIRNSAEVNLVYRKAHEFMPAQKHEIEEAREEGLKFSFLLSPLEFEGNKKLEAAIFEKVVVEREHFVMSGHKEKIHCDIAIVAAGQSQEEGLLNGTEMQGQSLEIHANKTKFAKVFAAGDIANKNKTVIHAIRSGREAAKEIDDFLTGKSNIPAGITKI